MKDSNTLVMELSKLLQKQGWMLAVAESCTGGLLGDMITSLSGSSEFFLGGVIAYSNQVKSNLLNVSTELLKKNGAVSTEVALSMARGVGELLRSSVGIAITGIAGPDGGNEEKPVGQVYIAVVAPGKEMVERFIFSGNRRKIKTMAAKTAIDLVLRVLK